MVGPCTPSEQLKRFESLTAANYRPASFSVARPDAAGPIVAVSVWHRPSPSENEKDRVAGARRERRLH